MTMKTIKVAEATERQLDWLVAKCEKVELDHIERSKAGGAWLWLYRDEDDRYVLYTPSTNWAQGGPIIEREGLLIRPQPGSGWDSWKHGADTPHYSTGPTALIAAMRCYANKLGETAEVPEELL